MADNSLEVIRAIAQSMVPTSVSVVVHRESTRDEINIDFSFVRGGKEYTVRQAVAGITLALAHDPEQVVRTTARYGAAEIMRALNERITAPLQNPRDYQQDAPGGRGPEQVRFMAYDLLASCGLRGVRIESASLETGRDVPFTQANVALSVPLEVLEMAFTRNRSEDAKRRTAEAAASMFRPGAKDDSDPDWLLETLTTAEVVQMVDACQKALDVHAADVSRGDHDLYSPWAKKFIGSLYPITRPYALIDGQHHLSGKQLVMLRRVYLALAKDTVKLLQAGGM